MKAATVKEIKQELSTRSAKELLDLCLHMSKFKKENKELLTYLLFESGDEHAFIEGLKTEIDELFGQINRKSFYFIKKGIRKILSTIKKYIRYSKKKETEVELLIYFCQKLNGFRPSIHRSTTMKNLYHKQLELVEKALKTLHEDLQYDYEDAVAELKKR